MGPCQEWGWHLIKGPLPKVRGRGKAWRPPARGPEYAQRRFSLQDEPCGARFSVPGTGPLCLSPRPTKAGPGAPTSRKKVGIAL